MPEKSGWIRYLAEHADRAAAWRDRLAKREAKRETARIKASAKREAASDLSTDEWFARLLKRAPLTIGERVRKAKIARDARPVVAVAPAIRRPLARGLVPADPPFARDGIVIAGSRKPERIGPQPFRSSPAMKGQPVTVLHMPSRSVPNDRLPVKFRR